LFLTTNRLKGITIFILNLVWTTPLTALNRNDMKKFSLFIYAALLFSTPVFSQETEPAKKRELPSVGLGAGILAFHGDVGKDVELTDFSRFRSAYHLDVEHRFIPFLGTSLNVLYGKMAQSERSVARNLNFESKIMQAALHVTFYFDNGFILKKDAVIAPFIGAGFGYLKFDSYTDLKNKDGKAYNYWDDGSIRDLPQIDSNYFYASVISRDYTYETKLVDPTNNYKRSTFSLPLFGGLQFKLTPSIDLNLTGTYYMTFTDYIDNFKEGDNDAFIQGSFSLRYRFGKREKHEDEQRYKAVDFGSIQRVDSDGDGIYDSEDKCQGTPKDVKVDGKGCPEDDDKDGVPDYMDKEKDTPRNSLVDANGVKISDDEIARRQQLRDSLATERAEVFSQNPSLRALQELDAKIKQSGEQRVVPGKFASADLNADGIIQSSEITAAVDSFLDGSSDHTAEWLNQLIDYFFEQ
jgi:hypothetical protein